jgi:hypothetical protein
MPISHELVDIAIEFIAIPWCIWVTVSLFNQRQEVALLKQIVHILGSKKIEISDPE